MGNNVKGKIYKILTTKEDKNIKVYTQLVNESYNLPKKLYGDIERYANILWNDFAKPGGRASALLVGKAGTGKTMFCKYISNIAIEKGVNVFILEGKNHGKEVIEYLSMINNAIVFIDEFGKQFSVYGEQDKLLSMLTDSERKRMFLFTENYMDNINEFILNRPGRIKYNFEFDILKNETISEYCKDNNISENIEKGLIELNTNKPSFCFDHMIAICETAKELGVDDVGAVIEVLNVPFLRGNVSITPLTITHIETNETLDLSRKPVSANGIIVAELISNNKTLGIEENDKEKEKIENFLKTFREDYANVNIHDVPNLDDDRWMIRDRMRGERLRKGDWVKVSLSEEFRLEEGKQNELVFKDITNKYKVVFKRGAS